MKRAAFFILLLAISTSVFAAAVTHPVLVQTKPHVGRLAVKSMAKTFDPDDPARDYREFTIVSGFAANLTDDEIAALRQSPNVISIEPDLERHAFNVGGGKLTPVAEAATPFPQITPYGIPLVHAPQVWPAGRGATINVVVMDSGVDYHHPELAAIYAGGQNFVAKPATSDPMDDNGHGTHCAGIIAAADNANGVVGVAPQVRLWAVKVLNASGSGRTADILSGLSWIQGKKQELGGNWIVSLSLGACQGSDIEGTAFGNAVTNGIFVVAAAGNHEPTQDNICTSGSTSNSYSVSFPAAYDGVVAVAAIDSTSAVADFSNFGPEVLLSAPGVDVLSTFPVGTGNVFDVVSTSGGDSFRALGLTGSPLTNFSGPYVYCGLGSPSEIPASVKGKIALIRRGDLKFHDKAKNAQAAGAIGVVIFNKSGDIFGGTLLGNDPTETFLPTVGISLEKGQSLVDHPQATLNITFGTDKDDYAIESGTSMACPHVAGVAAAVWSAAPGATATAIKQALTSTAHDLGDPGVDNKYGFGLVDAEAAARRINPNAFGPPAPIGGRTPGRRGH